METVLIMRGFERLAIVLVAGGMIYLGYRLFLVAPERTDGKGSFKWADLSIGLSKVGPGVFFALFGAFLLYQVVNARLSIDVKDEADSSHKLALLANADSPQPAVLWFGSTSAEGANYAGRATTLTEALNCVESRLSSDFPLGKAVLEDAIHTAKVAIISDVWQPKWGGHAEQTSMVHGSVASGSGHGDLYNAESEKCP